MYLHIRQYLRQLLTCNRKHAGMEGTAYVQQQGPLCTGSLKLFTGLFHGSLLTGNHNLPRAVVIGNPHAFHGPRDSFNGRCVQGQDGCHGSFSHRNCFLHQDSPLAHRADGVLVTHDAGCCQGTVFPQTQSGGHIRLNPFFLQHPHHGNAGSDHGGLGIFRYIQPVILLKTQLRHGEAQEPACFVKDFFACLCLLIEILAHPADLCSLSRENKCNPAHPLPPLNSSA